MFSDVHREKGRTGVCLICDSEFTKKEKRNKHIYSFLRRSKEKRESRIARERVREQTFASGCYTYIRAEKNNIAEQVLNQRLAKEH